MASNRLINKDTKKKSPLSSSGIVEEQVIKEDEMVKEDNNKIAEDSKEEIAQHVSEVKVDEKQEVAPIVKNEVAVEHTEAEIIKPQGDNLFDLFIIKKKEKIQKGQKNLVLKLSNIEFLEELAYNTKREQGEIVDTLLENLKTMMNQ